MLISKSEIISLAYISSITEAELKDEIISTVISKYIVPIVPPDIYQQATEDPEAYAVLIETHIKPCIAFYVKYFHINQLLMESRSYLPSDNQITKTISKEFASEILIIAEQKSLDLAIYVKANYNSPTSSKKLINGFLI